MKRAAREAGFAVLSWLIPFAVSVCIFPLKSSHAPLFETLMGVVVATCAVVLGCVYMRRVSADYLQHGLRIGLIWTATNWALDAAMFSSGPMKMALDQYVMDIGLAYLAIPAITIGLGFVAASASRERATASE